MTVNRCQHLRGHGAAQGSGMSKEGLAVSGVAVGAMRDVLRLMNANGMQHDLQVPSIQFSRIGCLGLA